MKECVKDATEFLKVLANSNRLYILCALMEGEQCVSDLLEEVPISQPLISQHLKLLRDQGIIASRKEAQKVYYSIDDSGVKQVLQTLAKKFKK